MKYGTDFFIKRFEAINPSKWCTRRYGDGSGRHCATGHCRCDEWNTPPMGWALLDLFREHDGHPVATNDGRKSGQNLGQGRKTPRGRILAALRWIKKQEAKA